MRVSPGGCSSQKVSQQAFEPCVLSGRVPENMVKRKYICPVCGYPMQDPPRDNNLCPSCGTEFGYHDAGRTFQDIRQEWLRSGAHWWSRYEKQPYNWNPFQQMMDAGFRIHGWQESGTKSGEVEPLARDAGIELRPVASVASVLFSCVPSVILTAERSPQLGWDSPPESDTADRHGYAAA